MSSCLAITSRSSATPPPVGAVSCAVAAPAASRTAATGVIAETHRVPARIGFVIVFLASKARRSDAAALGQVDEADLKREEVRGNGREDRAPRERRPRRTLMCPASHERGGAPQQSQWGRRCDGRARSISGNRRRPVRESRGRLPGRRPRRWERLAKRPADDGAQRTAPPEGASQKCRAARPHVGKPVPSACPSGPPLPLSPDARQFNPPGHIIPLHSNTIPCPAKPFSGCG